MHFSKTLDLAKTRVPLETVVETTPPGSGSEGESGTGGSVGVPSLSDQFCVPQLEQALGDYEVFTDHNADYIVTNGVLFDTTAPAVENEVNYFAAGILNNYLDQADSHAFSFKVKVTDVDAADPTAPESEHNLVVVSGTDSDDAQQHFWINVLYSPGDNEVDVNIASDGGVITNATIDAAELTDVELVFHVLISAGEYSVRVFDQVGVEYEDLAVEGGSMAGADPWTFYFSTAIPHNGTLMETEWLDHATGPFVSQPSVCQEEPDPDPDPEPDPEPSPGRAPVDFKVKVPPRTAALSMSCGIVNEITNDAGVTNYFLDEDLSVEFNVQYAMASNPNEWYTLKDDNGEAIILDSGSREPVRVKWAFMQLLRFTTEDGVEEGTHVQFLVNLFVD